MKFSHYPDSETGYSDDYADFVAQEHDEAEEAAAVAAATPNLYRQMTIDMATAHAAVLNTKKEEAA